MPIIENTARECELTGAGETCRCILCMPAPTPLSWHRTDLDAHRVRGALPNPGRLRQAIADYPESNAVLVRRHGVYVWGKDWVQAKTQAECYDYLFEAALRMHALGIDAARPPAPPPVSNGHHAAGPVASQCAVHLPR